MFDVLFQDRLDSLISTFYKKFKTSNRINDLKFTYLRCLNNVIMFEPLNNSFATK